MKIGLKGFWDIKLIGTDGKIKDHISEENLVTHAGFDAIIQRGFSTQTGSASENYIAIGSGATAAATSDTTLGSEAARQQGTYAHTDGGHNFSLTTTFAAGVATGTISEYGVLNASSSGQLFNRALTGTITKGASDTLQIVFAGSLS